MAGPDLFGMIDLDIKQSYTIFYQYLAQLWRNTSR